MRTLLGLFWLALGCFWGFVLRSQVLRGGAPTRARRFVAHWLGVTCWMAGVGGLLVITGEGKRQWSHGTWVRYEWPDVLLYAAIAGLLFSALRTFGGAAAEFPEPDVAALLAAEPTAGAADNRRAARLLVKRARRAGQPLPPPLEAFVRRHLPIG